jgi:alpha-galactosidase
MPERLKIAVVGAGSLPCALGLLQDTLLVHKLDGVDLALTDSDPTVLYPLVELGRRMAKKTGVDATLSAHADRAAALEGARYICCAAAPERHRRFASDCRIIQSVAPDQLITEFGGVAGIAYSLRQIRLIQNLCEEIKQSSAADAMLLNVSNPLPRVCQAAHDEGVETVGFCAASLLAYAVVWKILHGETLAFPFEMPRSLLDVSIVGLNHLTFVLDLWDHDAGEDLYPQLKQAVAAGRTAGQPITARLLLDTGYLPAVGDDRIRDFVPPTPQTYGCLPLCEAEDEKRRAQSLAELQAAAEGKAPWEPLLAKRSWERPGDFIAARSFDRPAAAFVGLNLINQTQLPQLSRQVFVETPATVDAKGVHPATFKIPESLLGMLRRTAELNDTIVRAARWSSQELLDEAVELDPTILDKTTGRRALEECLKAHADLLRAYV